MIIKTKRNIGDRFYKVQCGSIEFFDIERIKTTTTENGTSFMITLRINNSTRTADVFDEELSGFYDTPEKALAAVLKEFQSAQQQNDV